MLNQDRQTLIKKISSLRGNSTVFTYLTSNRPPFTTQIAEDVIPILQNHIDSGEKKNKISLFLFTRGGNMIVPLKIVNLLRGYYKNFEILIPSFAHSAGTLIALGADSIVMTKLGELSPVDPTTTHLYNPTVASPDPTKPSAPRPINVEDVNSYFLFAREKAKLSTQDMDKVYSYLINNTHLENTLHPLALGNVYRGYRMAKKLAERMLKMHMNGWFISSRTKKIVEALTGKIPTHDYPIYRDEARSLGLNIEYAENELEKTLHQLLSAYVEVMGVDKPFNPTDILGTEKQKPFESKGAFIESENLCHEFTYRGIITKKDETPPKVEMNIISAGWKALK